MTTDTYLVFRLLRTGVMDSSSTQNPPPLCELSQNGMNWVMWTSALLARVKMKILH